ncbi:LuxR family transcriptional regulator [Nocardia sp. NPDC051463]|uniref:helix-turn-helix transcriptional regulator n=1 Tax=Nocardia sp. NPDC051463 TaxID=3154845 RepID=UPI00344C3865
MLYGRAADIQQIGSLLDGARHSRSGALAIIAEAGEGKSALLHHAEELSGAGWRVLRCTGIESESELPFAGLHLLLNPTLDRIDAVPSPQRDALRGALGLCPAEQADRFLVGVATLSLLAELSAEGPVLCLIDDAQWLDRPSADALLFTARRLGAEGIVMLFAGRAEFTAPGLPELRPAPLDGEAAAALLADFWPDLEPGVRRRVLAEASGNPLALLELPRMDLDSPQLGPLPLPSRLQSGYAQFIADQSASARTAMLVVAAEETGDLGLVLRVLTEIGLTADALAEAERSGMVCITGPSVSFRHPLKRAAAYHSASFTQRLAVHAAIAAALADDPDRSAWHRAAAATGPDETVAAALEVAADRARDRTGHASAAAALERAASLTPDPAVRARRLMSAVEIAAEAGRTERALRLAEQAERLDLDPSQRGRIGGVRGLIEFEHGSLRKAHNLFMEAAEHLAEADPERAAWTLIEAGRASWTAGDLTGVIRARDRMAALPLGEQGALLVSSVNGPLMLHSGERAAGVAQIRGSVAFSRAIPLEMISIRLAYALQAALIGDMPDARELLAELAELLRNRGMIGWLPAVGCTLATTELILGRFREAELISTQYGRIAADIGQPNRVSHAEGNLAIIAAVRGDEQRCRELAERNLREAPADYNAIDIAHFHWALALLDLGLGRHELALDRLEAQYHSPNRARGQWIDLLSDLVEAAARLRSPERAVEALTDIEEWSSAVDSPWAEALTLRCQAQVHGDGELFGQAMKLHAAVERWYDYARTGLLYGEWLRRERRAGEARTHLRKALEIFDRLGAAPWAERARTELRAAGEGVVPEPETDLAAVLTPQEFQVVRLAAAGSTNKEIAAQLFLSPKTVGHHLYRAFPKLGVASRVELVRLNLD